MLTPRDQADKPVGQWDRCEIADEDWEYLVELNLNNVMRLTLQTSRARIFRCRIRGCTCSRNVSQ